MKLNDEQKKLILDYIGDLHLLPDNKKELLHLFKKGDYGDLLDKLDFYTQLEFKKDAELDRLSEKVIELEIKEVDEQDRQAEDKYAEDMVLLEEIQDADYNAALDQRYAEIEEEIDKINDRVIKKIVEVKNKHQLLDDQEEIAAIKHKLK